MVVVKIILTNEISLCYVQEKLTATVPGKEGHVRRIIHVGAGVWVSLRQEMRLILFHTTTYKILQEVNVKSNFINILKSKLVYGSLATTLLISCIMFGRCQNY